jgi:hypothetical protein
MKTETLSEWQNARVGKFTASEIWKLFVGGKSKTEEFGETAKTYIFEKAVEEYCGFKKKFSNKAMEHGVFNELEGFVAFVNASGLDFELSSSTFFALGDNAGASPDGVLYRGMDIVSVCDIKCPFDPVSFFSQKDEFMFGNKMPKYYFYQLQMQMLCTGANDSYLARYLTSSVVDEYGNKEELNIPEKNRIFWQKMDADKRVHEQILSKIEKAEALKQEYLIKFKI